MSTFTVAQHLSVLAMAVQECRATNNRTWEGRYKQMMEKILALLPDELDVHLDLSLSNVDQLVFYVAYQHLRHGMPGPWSQHTITVEPRFFQFRIRISGQDKGNMKERLHNLFTLFLSQKSPLSDQYKKPSRKG